jgi:hypothetical protein
MWCTKDRLDWAVINGLDRQSVIVVEHRQAAVPNGDRGSQLVWVRREVLELLERQPIEKSAVRVAEGGGQSVSLGRAEVEGVVQEALAATGLEPRRHVAASIRAAFQATNNAELATRLATLAIVSATAASRREPVVSAVALLPG